MATRAQFASAGSNQSHVPRPQRGCTGFTLVELVIIVAVAIILSAIGVTQIRAGLRQFRLQQGASGVAGALMDARLSALKRNRPTWLLIDQGARTVRVQATDGLGAATDLSPAITLPQGISFAAAPAQVDYDALGRLAAAQVITLTSMGGGSRVVTVSVTGVATVTNAE